MSYYSAMMHSAVRTYVPIKVLNRVIKLGLNSNLTHSLVGYIKCSLLNTMWNALLMQ